MPRFRRSPPCGHARAVVASARCVGWTCDTRCSSMAARAPGTSRHRSLCTRAVAHVKRAVASYASVPRPISPTSCGQWVLPLTSSSTRGAGSTRMATPTARISNSVRGTIARVGGRERSPSLSHTVCDARSGRLRFGFPRHLQVHDERHPERHIHARI